MYRSHCPRVHLVAHETYKYWNILFFCFRGGCHRFPQTGSLHCRGIDFLAEYVQRLLVRQTEFRHRLGFQVAEIALRLLVHQTVFCHHLALIVVEFDNCLLFHQTEFRHRLNYLLAESVIAFLIIRRNVIFFWKCSWQNTIVAVLFSRANFIIVWDYFWRNTFNAGSKLTVSLDWERFVGIPRYLNLPRWALPSLVPLLRLLHLIFEFTGAGPVCRPLWEGISWQTKNA